MLASGSTPIRLGARSARRQVHRRFVGCARVRRRAAAARRHRRRCHRPRARQRLARGSEARSPCSRRCRTSCRWSDQTIAKEAQRHFKKQGLDIKLGAKVARAAVAGAAVDVAYTDAQGEHTLQVDKLVVAVGRRPSRRICWPTAPASSSMRAASSRWTSIAAPAPPNVWAVGDVVRGPDARAQGQGGGHHGRRPHRRRATAR